MAFRKVHRELQQLRVAVDQLTALERRLRAARNNRDGLINRICTFEMHYLSCKKDLEYLVALAQTRPDLSLVIAPIVPGSVPPAIIQEIEVMMEENGFEFAAAA